MSRFPVCFAMIALAPAAVRAVGELPPVNYNRSVSALELYGVQRTALAAPVVGRDASGGEVLIPIKPSESLWSNDAPLRMPEKSEYKKYALFSGDAKDYVRGGSPLPEENMDELFSGDAEDYVGGDSPQENLDDLFADARIMSAPRNNAVKPAGGRRKKAGASVGAAAVPVNASAKPENTRVQAAPMQKRAPSVIRSAPKFSPAAKKPVAKPVDEEIEYKEEVPLTKLSPTGLKKAFKRTFSVENKHLATYQIDDGYDDFAESEESSGFDSARDLSEQGGVRPLEIKIGFYDDDSALSRDNYNLLAEYAGIVAANPKRALQISISERSTRSYDGRKLAARRLAIIEQVLKDSGIVDRRIIPVLSQRADDSIVLRVISSDSFQVLSEKKRDMFGDTIGSKTYKSLQW